MVFPFLRSEIEDRNVVTLEDGDTPAASPVAGRPVGKGDETGSVGVDG